MTGEGAHVLRAKVRGPWFRGTGVREDCYGGGANDGPTFLALNAAICWSYARLILPGPRPHDKSSVQVPRLGLAITK